MKFTTKHARRMSLIIHELSRMGRDGWQHSKAYDYLPLEAELRELLELKRRQVVTRFAKQP